MSCSRDEIEELIDDLIDSFDDYKAYYERSDFVQWSEEAEAGAMEKYHGIRDKIIELCINGETRIRANWVSVPHKNNRICNHCGYDEPYRFADNDASVYDYCPHCGAKITG